MAVVNTIPLAAVVIIASVVAVGASSLEFDVASQGFQEFYSGMKKALIAAGATHLQQSHLGAGGQHVLVLTQLKTHGAYDVLLGANGLEFDAASQGFQELCSGMEKVIAAIANHLQPSYLGAGGQHVLVLPRLMKTQEANEVLLEQLDNLLKTIHDTTTSCCRQSLPST
ncbi:unnamed protein product [Miscanthus lutarioriparius]|uniref:Uncharacterized protein n=1 Tax=Miscanthus lutarioriparius TaxID=422564 RepID=A0A811MM82_9POAL|nr:unnamed protein product [Miscanthus lutarioriparius]